MFKILVADDEKFIRKGIVSILSKNLPEEVQCFEASSGLEALESAKENRPDLIVTDISMPGISGLEFIAQLKELDVDTPVIILSGYANFEYAKRAIKLGVKEYVMKPIKKQEFVDLIKGYMDDIRLAEKRNSEETVRQIENRRVMQKLKRDFLVGLLKCTNSSEANQYLVQLKDVGMTFEARLYTCAVIQYRVTEENREYIDFAVKNVADEYIGMQADEEFVANVVYTPGQLVTIFEGSSREALKEPKKKIMRQAVRLIREYCKTDAYAGVGEVAYDSLHLHKAMEYAVTAADFKVFGDGDCVKVYEEIKDGAKAKPRHLAQLLKGNIDMFAVLDGLQQIFTEAGKKEDVESLRREYEELQDALDRKGWSAHKTFSECFTLSELKQELKKRMEHLENADSADLGVSNLKLMNDIRAYVDEHITEELDLNVVAEVFNRTPGYISTLFKKYEEGGFNNYINKERIEIAKKLLADRNIAIREIGEMCGYNNSKYFSVVFKKMTGDTPRSYRDKMLK